MDRRRLSQFEERIQALVEGGFARLFAGRLHPREVALRLARAMEDGASQGDNPTAPNAYEVHLNRDDCSALLKQQPGIAEMLPRHVSLAREKRSPLDSTPNVTSSPTTNQPHGVVVWRAHAPGPGSPRSDDGIRERSRGGARAARCRRRSCVMVASMLPLDRSVTNIGGRRDKRHRPRRTRASARQHCQIRYRFGHFGVDLGSRGGTFVNDARVPNACSSPAT